MQTNVLAAILLFGILYLVIYFLIRRKEGKVYNRYFVRRLDNKGHDQCWWVPFTNNLCYKIWSHLWDLSLVLAALRSKFPIMINLVSLHRRSSIYFCLTLIEFSKGICITRFFICVYQTIFMASISWDSFIGGLQY